MWAYTRRWKLGEGATITTNVQVDRLLLFYYTERGDQAFLRLPTAFSCDFA